MRRLRERLPLLLAVGAVVAYAGFALQRAWWFGTATPVAIALSAAVSVVVAVSMLLVVRELLFGFEMAKLAKAADPLPELPRTASGRFEVEPAMAEYELARAGVEAAPTQWQEWYRLAHAYDAARDRKQARAAMREAARLFRAGAGS